MNNQIELSLKKIINQEKISDSQLEIFGGCIADTLLGLSETDFLTTLDSIYQALLNKGHVTYSIDELSYEYIFTTHFMRGIYHHVKASSKKEADLVWHKLNLYFKSKAQPKVHRKINNPGLISARLNNLAIENTCQVDNDCTLE